MKTKSTLILTTLALLFVLTACSGGDAETAVNLDGTIWVLTDYQGNAPIGNAPTLNFGDGQVSGTASCNEYGGGYAVKGDELTFTELYNTEMFCMDPEGIMDQESAYLQLLGQTDSFEIQEGQLVLLSSGQVVLTFDPAN
jgi:heat shock protein HslJ